MLLESTADAVVGLTPSGGTWLIGLNHLHPDAFSGVPASGDDTGDAQLERLRACGYRVAVTDQLRELNDAVDAVEIAAADAREPARRRRRRRLPPDPLDGPAPAEDARDLSHPPDGELIQSVRDVPDHLSTLLPALAFLLAAVPLAALLGRLGFFDAVASSIASRTRSISLGSVVGPGRRHDGGAQPRHHRRAAHAAVPAAGPASGSRPRPGPGHPPAAGLPGLVGAPGVEPHDPGGGRAAPPQRGRRRRPPRAAQPRRHDGRLVPLPTTPIRAGCGSPTPGRPTRRALAVGGAVVAALLVGFTLGPSVGLPSWLVALVADLVLVVVTRSVPWRSVPLATAALVAAVAAVVALVVPGDLVTGLVHHDSPLALVAITGVATHRGQRGEQPARAVRRTRRRPPRHVGSLGVAARGQHRGGAAAAGRAGQPALAPDPAGRGDQAAVARAPPPGAAGGAARIGARRGGDAGARPRAVLR